MIIFRQKDEFPSLVSAQLSSIRIDYKERYRQIENSARSNNPELAAGVVLLIHYKQLSPGNSEYVFQLIKRSNKVSQAGDISCPGGILNPVVDKNFRNALKMCLNPFTSIGNNSTIFSQDKHTNDLINLFLANALREACEEIGLDPFKVIFLGALPCYSLTLIARTIFPVVCLTPEPFEFKLNPEVEKILEIPLSHFLDASRFAFLEIETPFDNYYSLHKNQFPCMVVTDNQGVQEILWGATFNIIMNFLRIISGKTLSVPSSARTIKKILSHTYISGNSK